MDYKTFEAGFWAAMKEFDIEVDEDTARKWCLYHWKVYCGVKT